MRMHSSAQLMRVMTCDHGTQCISGMNERMADPPNGLTQGLHERDENTHRKPAHEHKQVLHELVPPVNEKCMTAPCNDVRF